MSGPDRNLEVVMAGEDEIVAVMIDHASGETYQLFEFEDAGSAWVKVERFETLAEAEEALDPEPTPAPGAEETDEAEEE